MSKGSMLYVTSDALSLDNGSTPKVGDEVTVTVKSAGTVGSALTRAARVKGGKAGTLYKPATVKRLLKCVRDGLNLKQAATACGIGESTLHEWKREHPEFLQKLEETREQARQLALETIWAARDDDWRAAEAFLKYSFHQDYRSRNQVNLQQNTNVEVVEKRLTESERMKLIEQREANQKQLDAPQDKPAVIEAEVVAEQAQEQPEPQPEGSNQPPPGWHEAHEQRAKEAVINAKEEAERTAREQQIANDRATMARLFGDT